ncbi:MAG: thioredoxin domain-containing protein, partial [Methanoregulaceae archaeon]|nr:thioredoxin domain-containing protein [Methanoregulaceae archaeon]
MPEGDPVSDSHRKNRLSGETSPYLRLHAANPVDWYPWGEEAFVAAKARDRPVFLSIGYATCHWCHVMMRESFEDPGTAQLLNDAFVCVKVDREERPDIDAIYMEAALRLSGTGGWPLTVVTTPDKEPFFAATYIPPRSTGNTTGLNDLVPQIARLWSGDRAGLIATARSLTKAIRAGSSGTAIEEPAPSLLSRGFEELRSEFDDVNGGFGTSPKFPVPHTIMFLLRYWKRYRDRAAFAMAEKTLSSMAGGGIFDHLGGGFHRYSTDRAWSVPHFEKMLYDQALAALVYLEAYQATGREDFRDIAVSCLEYARRELRGPEGGFFAAQDAESGGEEGAYYLWTRSGIEQVLGQEEAARFFAVYHVTTPGNYLDPLTGRRTGKNILRASA